MNAKRRAHTLRYRYTAPTELNETKNPHDEGLYRYVAPMELEEKNVPKKSRRDDISVEYRVSPCATDTPPLRGLGENLFAFDYRAARSRIDTHSWSSCFFANASGVSLFRSRKSGLAPFSIRYRTTSAWPLYEAKCSAVCCPNALC